MVKIPVWFFKPEEATPDEGKILLICQESIKGNGRFCIGYYKDNEYYTSTSSSLLNPERILGWAYLLEPNMDHTQIPKEEEL